MLLGQFHLFMSKAINFLSFCFIFSWIPFLTYPPCSKSKYQQSITLVSSSHPSYPLCSNHKSSEWEPPSLYPRLLLLLRPTASIQSCDISLGIPRSRCFCSFFSNASYPQSVCQIPTWISRLRTKVNPIKIFWLSSFQCMAEHFLLWFCYIVHTVFSGCL